jgi:hypothetical protein
MSLPHLSSLYELYQSENQPFRKVHRMVDLFESVIKTYTAVMMAEYFRRSEVSDAVKGLLANGLRTPSLGTWQLFSRELYRELKAAGHGLTLPGFGPSNSRRPTWSRFGTPTPTAPRPRMRSAWRM